jgi:hypothetical protein
MAARRAVFRARSDLSFLSLKRQNGARVPQVAAACVRVKIARER